MDQFSQRQAKDIPIKQGEQISTPREGNRRRQHAPEPDLARRTFLRRAAIVGATAGVAVAGAGVVAAAEGVTPERAARSLVRHLNPQIVGTASGATGTMCFEDTGFNSVSSFTVHSNGMTSPGDFFIWLTGHNLPAGSYTFSITPTLGDGTTPFEVTAAGNDAFVYQSAAGGASDCPSGNPSNQVEVAHTPALLAPATITSTSDLQLKVHIKYDGGAISSSETITFTGQITNGAITISASATVTANPG